MSEAYTPAFQEYISGTFITLVLHWKDSQILSIDLQWKILDNINKKNTKIGRGLKHYLLKYEQKKPLPQISLPLNWSIFPHNSFSKKILQQLSKVPYGTVTTYGALAKQANSPYAARAVGSIMAKNPWPFIIPCHRVIGTNGSLIGFTGNGGLHMKEWLLKHEGFIISKKIPIYTLENLS